MDNDFFKYRYFFSRDGADGDVGDSCAKDNGRGGWLKATEIFADVARRDGED